MKAHETLKELRKLKKLTPSKLAIKARMRWFHYHCIENNIVIPNRRQISCLCIALGVTQETKMKLIEKFENE